MKDTESESLQRQLQAYMDNMFNVRNLLQESELKITALERVEILEDQLLNVCWNTKLNWKVKLTKQ